MASVLAAVGTLVVVPAAIARVIRIQISTRESPTFGGHAFPGVGQYEKIVGKAFGELDPRDPKNAVIVDIQLAPRNRNGMVEYSFDFYILKPIDLSRGNHKVMYEPPNRGGKTHATLNRGAGGNDPGAVTGAAALADTFLLPRGYTLVWSGWDRSAGDQHGQLQHHDHPARGDQPRRLADHRPGLRIHREPGARRTPSAIRPRRWIRQGEAHASRASGR